MGSNDAPNEIVVFSDFQCPFCKKAAVEMKRLSKKYPNKFRLYFKHFPLSYHAQSQKAARAAEAARIQGKFWQMHDLLFEYAQELNDKIYLKLAAKLKLDTEKFSRDFESFKTVNRISADRAEGEILGVDGTPYFIINGTPLTGSYTKIEQKLLNPR